MATEGVMEATQLKSLLARFKVLKEQRQSYETDWKEVNSVVNPHRQWWDTNDPGKKTPAVKLYDTTAKDALETWAGGMQGYAVSPAFKFFKLKMGDDRKARLPYVQDWLEEVETPMYAELSNSNFYESFDQMTKDVGSTGNGFIFMDDNVKKGTINFSCRHPKECFIAEDYEGRVDTLFRYFRVTIRTMYEQFPDAKMSDNWDTRFKNNPDEYVNVIHAVYPRGTNGVTRTKKPFASVYINEEDNLIIDEGGYDDFPYLVWRFRKSSDEVYGHGIGTDALPEILRVNQMAKSLLTIGERIANPAWNIPTKLQGRESLIPNGRNYIDPMISGKVEPVQMGGNIPFTWTEFNDQREAIKAKFFVNFFLMLESQQSAGKMTATEILEKQSEKAAILGGMLGRLNADCLVPLLNRVYAILDRRMEIPKPPEELLREGGKIDIEFLGPLAQAQRRFNENTGVQATIGLISALVAAEGAARQSGAVSIDCFNLDELANSGAQAAGSPQKAIREKPEIEKIRIDRAAAQQAQEDAAARIEQQKTLASNVDKLNQPMREGSMLESVVS